MVRTVRDVQRAAKRVHIGAPDPHLTGNAGIVAVTELTGRLRVRESIDAAVGPIKQRRRGVGVGGLLVGIASAQLAGQDFMVGLDRVRADTAGQELVPVPGLAASTAAGLAMRIRPDQWDGVERRVAAVGRRMLGMLPASRRVVLEQGATIDIDATDVEVYGRRKAGVAYNYAGQRCGRPDVAIWAETETALAADLLAGNEDPRSSVVGLLDRAARALPDSVRAGGVRLRVDAGYFAGDLARAARRRGLRFAIGAKRVSTMWRALAGLDETCWTQAKDMTGAQVALADYHPGGWPKETRLLIRRVRLEAGQVSTDPRSRRRRTLSPDQRVLPIAELQAAGVIYAYSFIATDLDCATTAKAVQVEHWYRHRTTVENVFRDGKHGAGLLHLPSGHVQINRAWMWGALLAVNIAGWLHELTATTNRGGRRSGWGTRDGNAMIATLRRRLTATTGRGGSRSGWGTRDGNAMIATLQRRLIATPARLVHHAGQVILRPAPGDQLLAVILALIRALPAAS